MRGDPVRVAQKSVYRAASSLLLKFNFLGQVKDGSKPIKEFRRKSVRVTETKRMANFIAHDEITTSLWFKKGSNFKWLS